MNIGILAFIVSVILLCISAMGIRKVEPPKQKEKTVKYPFPTEL